MSRLVIVEWLTALAPAVVVVVLAALALALASRGFDRGGGRRADQVFRRQMASITIVLVALVALVLVVPIDESRRGQLVGLLAVVLSAMIALGSTSLFGNALAGLMLRAQRAFAAGDFLEVEGHFGRVSERGLFHVEIQTESRELTTLPNLFLAGHPLTVLRSSGTLVSATISLGYDVPRSEVKTALVEAALAAGLGEPFVRILELGDFSVTYRVSGLLAEVKKIVSARSRLNARVLDSLHAAGIEIVSPTFMNQRQVAAGQRFIPKSSRRDSLSSIDREAVEALMFDKAEAAENLDRLRELAEKIRGQLGELKTELAGADSDGAHQKASDRSEDLKRRLEWLEGMIERREEEGGD